MQSNFIYFPRKHKSYKHRDWPHKGKHTRSNKVGESNAVHTVLRKKRKLENITFGIIRKYAGILEARRFLWQISKPSPGKLADLQLTGWLAVLKVLRNAQKLDIGGIKDIIGMKTFKLTSHNCAEQEKFVKMNLSASLCFGHLNHMTNNIQTHTPMHTTVKQNE